MPEFECDERYLKYRNKFGDPTESLCKLYGPWQKDIAKRDGAQLFPMDFDPVTQRGQNFFVPKLDAKDQFPNLPDWLYYAGVDVKLARSLGVAALIRLSSQLRHQPTSDDDSRPLIGRLVENHKNGRNTMVVTSHFTFPELGYFNGLRFCAERDRPNIDKRGILVNKLMAFQKFKGKSIADHFTPVGNVYFSYPKTASAVKYEIPKCTTLLGNAIFKRELRTDLKKRGLELDAALTGTQMVTHRRDNGEVDHYEMPQIDSASTTLVEDFDDIFGTTLIKSPVTRRWEMEISQLYDVHELLKSYSSAGVVDLLYGHSGIARSVENITGKEVDYHKISTDIGKQAIEQGFK
jgi:hypothetical protein